MSRSPCRCTRRTMRCAASSCRSTAEHPIAELLAACWHYVERQNARNVTFEYVMLDGVNDRPEHARELAALLRGRPAKVNLIPFNPFPGTHYRRSPEHVDCVVPRPLAQGRRHRDRAAHARRRHRCRLRPARRSGRRPHDVAPRGSPGRDPRGDGMTRPVSFGFAATLAIVAAVAACTSSSPKINAESRSKAAQTNAQLGMTYLHQGNLAAARDRIDKAIEQDPRTSETQMAAGFLYDRLGDDRKAQSHYDQAVRLADGNPEVLNNAAVFYCRKGDKKRGEKLFLEAAGNAMYRTPAAAYTNAGRCARADGRPADAESYFRKALAYQPDQPDALLQMADLNHDGGNDFQARAFLQRYMAIGPVNPQALWLGYRIERKLGDSTQSQEYARRLRTEFATSAETRELLEAEQGG